MAVDPPFRFRGVRVLVDTVQAAELDAQLYAIPDTVLAQIARNLKDLPQSVTDRAVGNFLIREIQGYDVVYIVGRDGPDLVITIGRIRLPDPANTTEDLLKSLNLLAIFRGASGL